MNILAVGAHPDDIELGCGGTLMKAARAGHQVFLYVLTRGEASGDPIQRTKEAMRAAKFMGARALWLDKFDDANLPLDKTLINHIEYFIHRSEADIVFTHCIDDYHHDHRSIASAIVEAGRFCRNVVSYELPVTQHFDPQFHHDISDVLERKVELISLFSSQREKFFTDADAVTGLSKYRALQNRLTGTMKAVESFQVMRACIDIEFKLISTPLTPVPKSVFRDLDLGHVMEYLPQAETLELEEKIASLDEIMTDARKR